MKKLLAILIAGLFASSVFSQTSSTTTPANNSSAATKAEAKTEKAEAKANKEKAQADAKAIKKKVKADAKSAKTENTSPSKEFMLAGQVDITHATPVSTEGIANQPRSFPTGNVRT